jgi:hypothetical protein
MLRDQKSVLGILDDVLKVDPGNDAARQERLKAEAMSDPNK